MGQSIFAPDAATTLYFPQTKHAAGGAFLKYWLNNGGLSRLGYPVTEEMAYKDNNGKTWTVQFFERIGKIGDLYIRYELECAGGRFCHHT